MRNYVELWFCFALYEPHPSPGPLTYFVWGANEEDLMKWYRFTKATNGGDDKDWRSSNVQQIYCKLDLENLVRIFNTPTASFYLWLNTRIEPIPPANYPGRPNWLWEVTQMKAEGSPRKKWSHGH